VPILLITVLAALGCRQDMHDAPRIDALEASDFFPDGQGARPLVAGTIARGFLEQDAHWSQGRDEAGELATTLPMPLTRALLARGRQRFGIFCSPCHDATGSGRGMIVRRGFKQPSSYHTDRLRAMPIGYFFDVITNGYGQMSRYAPQVPTRDRWAIAAYIRALQLSQHVPMERLPASPAATAGDAHESVRGAQKAEAAPGPEPGYGMALPRDGSHQR